MTYFRAHLSKIGEAYNLTAFIRFLMATLIIQDMPQCFLYDSLYVSGTYTIHCFISI